MPLSGSLHSPLIKRVVEISIFVCEISEIRECDRVMLPDLAGS